MNYVEFLIQFEKSKDPVFVKINADDEYIGPEYGFRVVTTCEMWQNGKHLATGKAVLNISDEYSQKVGHRLAAKRALDIAYPFWYPLKREWRLLRIAIGRTPHTSDKVWHWWRSDDGFTEVKEVPRYKHSTAVPF